MGTQFSENGTMFSCRFCGVSHESEIWIDKHVETVCSKTTIFPQNQTSKLLALFNDGDEDDRQRRFPKRVKCAQCNVEFYSERERILHTEKTNRCNGYITCRCCGGAFATTRATSHDTHSCFNKVDGMGHSEYVARVMNIKDIRNPCMRPVKCVDCGNIIQTFGLFKRHKNALSKIKTQAKCGSSCA